jgi:hypothetical protein
LHQNFKDVQNEEDDMVVAAGADAFVRIEAAE